jgi:hypothetical protein
MPPRVADRKWEVVKSASVEEFGKIELKVLKLVVSYCYYFSKGLPIPSAEYQAIKTQEDYYYMARQLSTEGKLRVGSAKLSSIIQDSKMAEIIRSMEE